MSATLGSRGPGSIANRASPPRPTRSATVDRDEAERIVGELYLPNRLDLSPGSAPLDMEVTGLRLGALTVGRLTYGRRVRLRTADAENFHVNIPLRGRASSRSGSCEPVATGMGEGLVFSPGAPAEMAWSADCEQLCLMIPRTRLEAELERLLGRSLRGRLTFDFTADLHNPIGRRWRTVLDLLVDELDQPTAVGHDPRVGGHVEGLVLGGVLLSQPHSHHDAVVADRPVRLGTAIKRAVELIEDRPSEPWTAVRLAAEVHLSVRALQEGFRRDLDTPPMTYLRQVRLRRAHEALLAADRDTTTVGAIAIGLGILHLGRFAAAYRAAFGEALSDTLNRPA
ncbi:AraC family transcriptional regulator [Georgenia muralis]|uniref:AraC family transcriptional regulator n=1 Tax=Georgenia muralis TaxID=154117 RepID=A0A3N4Z933_9MICO|nr:AraC family transcriptional regulator [Georgenia muralis]RPF28534.1 AraC family transcriptional regulator [Georgenia muralis]